MFARQKVGQIAGDNAQIILPARLNRHGQITFHAAMVDQQFRRFDGGKGEAGFAERNIKVGLFGSNRIKRNRITRLDFESGSHCWKVIAGSGKITQINYAKAIPLTGHNIEARRRRRQIGLGTLVHLSNRADHLRIVITIDSQHPLQQLFIIARLHAQPREIAVILKLLDGGQALEPVEKFVTFREQCPVRREDQHQLVRNTFFTARRKRRNLLVKGHEIDGFLRFERSDLGQIDLFGPRNTDLRHFRQRRIRIERKRRILLRGSFRRNAFLRPFLRILHSRIRDQILERRRVLPVLRSSGLRDERQHCGKRGRGLGQDRNEIR